MPTTALSTKSGSSAIARPQAGVVQNTLIDGMNIAATTDYPVEQFDRIEVLNGLAGALYGPASPAGTFNSVLERPTPEAHRRVTLGYATQSSALAAVDIGDSLGDTVGAGKRFGYRLNALVDRGEGYVQFSRPTRASTGCATSLIRQAPSPSARPISPIP